MQIIGILILVVFIGLILYGRYKISLGDNYVLKTAQKISDTYIWFKFIGSIILVIYVFGIFTIFAKKH